MLWNATVFPPVNPFLTSDRPSDRRPQPRIRTALPFYRWRNWGSESVHHLPGTYSWKQVWNKRAGFLIILCNFCDTHWGRQFVLLETSQSTHHSILTSHPGSFRSHLHPVSWERSASDPVFLVALSPSSADISPAFSLYPEGRCSTCSKGRPRPLWMSLFCDPSLQGSPLSDAAPCRMDAFLQM